MRVALLVTRPTPDRAANLAALLQRAEDAARAGATLLLFPEAALTGLLNDDDPAHDLPLGETIPGPATDALAAFTRRRGVWLGLGLLERDGGCLYDTAVLLDPHGETRLRYRRLQPQWHGPQADPAVYRQGSEIAVTSTPFGTVSFLVCGDLFDDGIVDRLRAARPDLLLVPFARCFADGAVEQARWEREELPAYCARVRRVGVPALLVNYLGAAVAPILGGGW